MILGLSSFKLDPVLFRVNISRSEKNQVMTNMFRIYTREEEDEKKQINITRFMFNKGYFFSPKFMFI